MPDAAAFEAAAPLVECAEKVDVSIPASFNCSLIQRQIVDTEATLFGLFELRKSEVELDKLRKDWVRSRYNSMAETGQIETFWGQESIEICWKGPEC